MNRQDPSRLVSPHDSEAAVVAEPGQALFHLFRAATATRQHLEASALRPHDITWTAFIVLDIVSRIGHAETRRVAEEAGISKGTLTGVVRTLAKRDLLERHSHPTDGRLVVLILTESGEELTRGLRKDYNAEAAFVAKALNGADVRTLTWCLSELAEHLHHHGAMRRRDLHADVTLPRRRSGRRANQRGE